MFTLCSRLITGYIYTFNILHSYWFGLLVFFLLKEPKKDNTLNLLFINKISALVINNILMIIATLTILLGTIYPIIIEVLNNKEYLLGVPILIQQ